MQDYRMETFLSLCSTLSYRRTAELLHITQPAVTQHIQHLEKVYGCRLFRYESRRLHPTAGAEILEKYAREFQLREEELLRRLQGQQIENLRIGATKTIGECVVSPYVEAFLEDKSRELTLIVDNTRHLLGLIDRGKLDFALIEGSFDKTQYGSSLFSRESFVGICGENHPFAGKEVCVPRLLQETLICREEGSGTRAILENKLLDYNESIAHFRRKICISSFPMILDYVKKGMGVSFVFEVLAKQNGLATFRILNCSVEREFNIVFLKNTDAEEKIRCFLGTEKGYPGIFHPGK